jgi:hypothetical protein
MADPARGTGIRQPLELRSAVFEATNRPGLRRGRYGIRTHGDPEATTAFEADGIICPDTALTSYPLVSA